MAKRQHKKRTNPPRVILTEKGEETYVRLVKAKCAQGKSLPLAAQEVEEEYGMKFMFTQQVLYKYFQSKTTYPLLPGDNPGEANSEEANSETVEEE